MSAAAIASKLIGRTDADSYGHRERTWWIGKPWRRIELNVYGEGESREWDLTVTLAVPRLGWHWHTAITRSFNDYGDEPNQ